MSSVYNSCLEEMLTKMHSGDRDFKGFLRSSDITKSSIPPSNFGMLNPFEYISGIFSVWYPPYHLLILPSHFGFNAWVVFFFLSVCFFPFRLFSFMITPPAELT